MNLNFEVMRVFKERVRLTRVLTVLLLLVAGVGQVWSQNVTIKSTNGNMIASIPEGATDYDTFFKCGGFASWQHEQLNMVLTASDATTLTPNGQLSNPANNLFSSGEHIQIGKGYNSYPTCYLSVTLPKGYRFTSYTITFTKSRETKRLSGGESVTFNDDTQTSRFGETDSSFGTYITSDDISTSSTEDAMITRTEMSEGDMGNVLYFKLMNPSNNTSNRALITLVSAEFEFTAEENYSPVTPSGSFTSRTAVDVPFATSKVDFGTITSNEYDNVERISYSSANVHDLAANFKLYESTSLTDTDGSDFDAIAGKVVDYRDNGTISSAGSYFKFDSKEDQTIYFIETPTYVEIDDDNNTKIPVGYRIVGAKFDYSLGGGSSSVNHYYITYTSGGTTYYLDTYGNFVTNTKTDWTTDGSGRVCSGNTYLGFTVSGSGPNRTYSFGTFSSVPTYPLYIDTSTSNNYIYGTYQGNQNTYTLYLYYSSGSAAVSTNTSNRALWTEETETTDLEESDGFTLYVYDKTGENPQVIEVNSDNSSGSVILDNLNNDAVKFGVKGMGYVQGTLTLQALNPYLSQMTVVCQDEQEEEIRMTETFTASDFSVSGGEFYFYLPDELKNTDVKITFEDLKSKYFDETYEGGSVDHNSRINFVKSEHYNAFGETDNNVYNDTEEAANATEERLKVGLVGTKKFQFNNADEVGEGGGIYREFPFSLKEYEHESGAFNEMEFKVSTEDQSLTRYVFTTDETRYNIAPTTATQHRAYAFYEMIVHVQSHTYKPKFQFTEIYDQTLYGTGQKDAFYGVTVTATDGNGKPGYSSTSAIYDGIENILNETHVDDFNNDVPEGTTAKQILYLDFSQLAGVYQITTDTHGSMEEFSETNAPNCMIFVPEGSGGIDNVAYKTEAGTYRAAQNIVLTDKQPFYTPYDIYVSSANKVTYKREVTIDKYDKVKNASLILPFIITVDENGVHTNADGTSFSLHTMQDVNSLTWQDGKTYAFFPALYDVKTTEANTPYLVKLDENSTEDNISFVVEQTGSTIYATKDMLDDYTFTGDASTGVDVSDGEVTQKADTYTFTPTGTYAGQEVNKNNDIFYFAENRFLSSLDLDDNHETVKIAPFRAYYATSSNGAKLHGFDIIFGEGEGDSTDGITDVTKRIDGSVKAGYGTITISTVNDSKVNINTVAGASMMTLGMSAGETRTVNVPAGIYVVNGIKIIVK